MNTPKSPVIVDSGLALSAADLVCVGWALQLVCSSAAEKPEDYKDCQPLVDNARQLYARISPTISLACMLQHRAQGQNEKAQDEDTQTAQE